MITHTMPLRGTSNKGFDLMHSGEIDPLVVL